MDGSSSSSSPRAVCGRRETKISSLMKAFLHAQKKNVARAMRDVSMLYRTPEATKLCIWTPKFVISFLAEFRRARERRERDLFVRDASSLCRRNVACVCFQFHSFGIKKKFWIADTFQPRARREKQRREKKKSNHGRRRRREIILGTGPGRPHEIDRDWSTPERAFNDHPFPPIGKRRSTGTGASVLLHVRSIER